jgi:DNA gyrase subunit A
MKLEDDDELGWARLTSGNDDILLVTERGQVVRFPEKDIRPTRRQAGGVRGIRLHANDRLTSMEIAEPGGYLLIVTKNGYGKRTSLGEYLSKSRATMGIKTINQRQLMTLGKVVSGRVVQENDQITLISSNGMVLRLRVDGINPTSRATRGVRVMDLIPGDTVASVARISVAEVVQPDEENLETAPDDRRNDGDKRDGGSES